MLIYYIVFCIMFHILFVLNLCIITDKHKYHYLQTYHILVWCTLFTQTTVTSPVSVVIYFLLYFVSVWNAVYTDCYSAANIVSQHNASYRIVCHPAVTFWHLGLLSHSRALTCTGSQFSQMLLVTTLLKKWNTLESGQEEAIRYVGVLRLLILHQLGDCECSK